MGAGNPFRVEETVCRSLHNDVGKRRNRSDSWEYEAKVNKARGATQFHISGLPTSQYQYSSMFDKSTAYIMGRMSCFRAEMYLR